MGRFLNEANVKMALIGLPKQTADRIAERFTRRSEEDAGRFDVTPYADAATCLDAIEQKKVTAVCIWYRALKPAELVAFIGNIRVTHPLIPFCLVGTGHDLDRMPGLHQEWRSRFSHYYKISENAKDGDFDDNVGLIRDLLVADTIKARALGHYETAPGGIVRLKHANPGGFWIMALVTLMAAILGAVIGPLVTVFLAAHK
jgi:hypothetical protein